MPNGIDSEAPSQAPRMTPSSVASDMVEPFSFASAYVSAPPSDPNKIIAGPGFPVNVDATAAVPNIGTASDVLVNAFVKGCFDHVLSGCSASSGSSAVIFHACLLASMYSRNHVYDLNR